MSATIARIAFISFLFTLVFAGAWTTGVVLKEPDICFLLAGGRWICEHGSLPVDDPFAWTLTLIHVQPILEQWLTEVVFYWLYQIGGGALLLVFDAVVLALTFAALPYRICRLKGVKAVPSLLLVFLCEWCSFSHLTVRPEIFSALFIALLLELLTRMNSEEPSRAVDWRYVLAFGVIMILWVNLHSLFIAGPILLAGYLGARIFEQVVFKLGKLNWTPFLSLVASIAVLPINPYGFKLLKMMLDFFLEYGKGSLKTHVNEMNPLQASDLTNPFCWPFFLLSIVGVIVIVKRYRKPEKPGDLFFSVMIPAAIYAGIKTVRTLPLSGLLLVVGAAHLIGGKRKSEVEETTPTSVDQAFDSLCPPSSWRWVFTCALFGGVGAYLMSLIVVPEFPQSSKAFSSPVKAVAFIDHARPSGNLLNDPHFGDVMMWQLHDSPKLFVDSRYYLFPPRMVDEYWDMALCHDNWQELLKNYKIDWIFLPPNLPLVKELSHHADWKVLYQDDVSAVLSRSTPSQE